MSVTTPGERLAQWRDAHWPPAKLRQYGELPIYIGDPDTVTEFAETLADAMMVAADHIYDACRGRVPRWMQVPKIHFGVERLNVLKAPAKASKRFTTATELLAKCGEFPAADLARVEAWLRSHERAVVVAHKPFIDLRAYVFAKGREEPERVRFYESGLVIATAEGFTMQDHRTTQRRKRKDALTEPLAVNGRGWSVFGKIAPEKEAAETSA